MKTRKLCMVSPNSTYEGQLAPLPTYHPDIYSSTPCIHPMQLTHPPNPSAHSAIPPPRHLDIYTYIYPPLPARQSDQPLTRLIQLSGLLLSQLLVQPATHPPSAHTIATHPPTHSITQLLNYSPTWGGGSLSFTDLLTQRSVTHLPALPPIFPRTHSPTHSTHLLYIYPLTSVAR